MDVVRALLMRLFGLVGSYILASLAAAAIVVLAIGPLAGATQEFETMAMIGSIIVLSLLVGGFAALPALAIVAAAEIFAIRSVLYYLVAFGLVGALPWLPEGGGLFYVPLLDHPVFTTVAGDERRLIAAVAAGFVFGAVFWLAAGRSAGRWRGRPTAA